MKRCTAIGLLLILTAAGPAAGQGPKPEREKPEKEKERDRDKDKDKDKDKDPTKEQPLAVRSEELNLSVGENKTIPATDVVSYSEGKRGIAEIKLTPDASKFVVVGQAPGATTLLLLKKDGQVTYTINVFSRDMQTVERELFTLLEGTTGIRVRRVGARFFIEGGVSTEPELKRIAQIAALFPGQVESLVVLGGAAAERKLNVRIDFFFVQYDRTRSFQFGTSWPATIGGAGVASASGSFDFLGGAVTSAQASVVEQPLPGWTSPRPTAGRRCSSFDGASPNGRGELFERRRAEYIVSAAASRLAHRPSSGTDVTVLHARYDHAQDSKQGSAEVMD